MPGSIPGSPTIFAVTSGAKNQPSGWFFRLMRDGLRGQTFESPDMRSYSFTHAITRQPPASAIHGLREVFTPPGVLHFKTDCSLLDAETILATERLDASGCFKGSRVIHTEPGEEACANAIRFNDLVLFPAGFPRTRDKLLAAGFNLREIGNSECAKLDGGMSCLSLRFSPSA